MKTVRSIRFKALLCFVLTVALCLPMFMACSEDTVETSSDVEYTEESSIASSAESKDESIEQSSEPEQQENPKVEVDGLFTAEFVDPENVDKIENCTRFKSDKEYNIFHVLFTPKSKISNVKIYEIDDDLNGEVVLGDVLFEASKVTSEKPLLADIEIPDAVARNCISFTDGSDKVHYYKIIDSAKDGSLIVSKTEVKTPFYASAMLPEKTSYKLLFIGNSATYVNDIPANLAKVCASKGITITQKQIVPGGRTLEQHAADASLFAEIAKGYDAVFIQENGNSIITDAERAKSLKAIEKIGKAVHESGAKFYFYVRPPYGKDLGSYKNFDQCKVFDDHFTPAAEEYDASCVYVNRAFAYAIKNCGGNLWGSDNAHTNTRGGYLAVCTFYATLFGKSATELDILFNLPEAEAKALQQAADKIALEGVIPWA